MVARLGILMACGFYLVNGIGLGSAEAQQGPTPCHWVCDANFTNLGTFPPFAEFEWGKLLKVKAARSNDPAFDVKWMQRVQAVGTLALGTPAMQVKARLALASESHKQQVLHLLEAQPTTSQKLQQAGSVPGLPDLFIRDVNAQSLDLGSAEYLKFEQRDYIAAPILQYWKEHPAAPCRLAIDVLASREVWQQWIGFAQLPSPWDTELNNLTQTCHFAFLSLFLKGDTFLVIDLVTDDVQETSRLKAMADGLLYFARFQVGSFLKEGSFGDGKVDLAVERLLRDSVVYANENTVSIRVPNLPETHLLVSHLVGLLGKSTE